MIFGEHIQTIASVREKPLEDNTSEGRQWGPSYVWGFQRWTEPRLTYWLYMKGKHSGRAWDRRGAALQAGTQLAKLRPTIQQSENPFLQLKV